MSRFFSLETLENQTAFLYKIYKHRPSANDNNSREN